MKRSQVERVEQAFMPAVEASKMPASAAEVITTRRSGALRNLFSHRSPRTRSFRVLGWRSPQASEREAVGVGKQLEESRAPARRRHSSVYNPVLHRQRQLSRSPNPRQLFRGRPYPVKGY